MENCLRRTTIQVTTDEKGKVQDEEYEKYKLQTRGEYEELMMEFEFRCRRAAMMNYHEASGYDKKVQRMEYFAAFLGSVSVASVGAWFMNGQTSFSFNNVSKLGAFGLVGMAAAFVIELMGKGGTKLIPSFTRRAEFHIAAGAAWQRLAQKTRSYRVQLDNPRLDVTKYAEWYDDLIIQREKLCTKVIIPQSTYALYNDPRVVFKLLRRRKEMFSTYLELEDKDDDDAISHVKI